MKNLFNDISQDERNRILEMHSGKKNVILEQDDTLDDDIKTLIGNKINGDTKHIPGVLPNPTPKPKPISVPTPFDSKTVNLYKDKGETQLLGTFKILKPVKEGSIVKIIIDNDGRIGGTSRFLEFQCGTSEPIVFLKGKNPQNFKERELKPLGLFNLKFLRALEKQYCTVSRGGKFVPKADFAMNNQQDDTTTGIA